MKMFLSMVAIAAMTIGPVTADDHEGHHEGSHGKEMASDGSKMKDSKSIVEIASGSKDHSTLVAAVKAAGLVETLSGDGPFTVFAPSNEAFKALPDGTVDMLLKPENKKKLSKILTYHVLKGTYTADTLVKGIKAGNGETTVKTVAGEILTAKMDGDKVKVMDANGNMATVTKADLKGSNGVIHCIDKVLMPSS